MWGWFARALVAGDRPKYLTPEGFQKSLALYGVNRVDDMKSPVLICEGPTDVWRAGKNAVAIIGKHASITQVRLIKKLCHGRPLVVALDGDAHAEGEVLAEHLRKERASSLLRQDTAPVVVLHLPGDRDPGDMETEQIWKMARRALRSASCRQM